MKPRLRDQLVARGFSTREPAENFALARLIAEAPFALPAAYLDLLLASNGGEGPIAGLEHLGESAPERVFLHSAQSALSEHRGYCVDELAPDCLLIGTDGKGVFYLLEEGDAGRVLVCRASEVGDRSAWKPAFDDFRSFVLALGAAR